MVSGGLKKVRPEIQVHFSTSNDKEEKEYKDKFTKELPTMEDVKKKYGAVIWCKYIGCKYNAEVEGLQRTSGSLLKNLAYSPLSEQESIWSNICTRDEIGIKFDEVRTTSAKVKVPSCFVASTKKTGHVDFSRFLQSDGTPIGGNIDSQHVSDAGYGALDPNNIYEE